MWSYEKFKNLTIISLFSIPIVDLKWTRRFSLDKLTFSCNCLNFYVGRRNVINCETSFDKCCTLNVERVEVELEVSIQVDNSE